MLLFLIKLVDGTSSSFFPSFSSRRLSTQFGALLVGDIGERYGEPTSSVVLTELRYYVQYCNNHISIPVLIIAHKVTSLRRL